MKRYCTAWANLEDSYQTSYSVLLHDQSMDPGRRLKVRLFTEKALIRPHKSQFDLNLHCSQSKYLKAHFLAALQKDSFQTHGGERLALNYFKVRISGDNTTFTFLLWLLLFFCHELADMWLVYMYTHFIYTSLKR